jgi:hypothetical protein
MSSTTMTAFLLYRAISCNTGVPKGRRNASSPVPTLDAGASAIPAIVTRQSFGKVCAQSHVLCLLRGALISLVLHLAR